jgi:hypothetical protein
MSGIDKYWILGFCIALPILISITSLSDSKQDKFVAIDLNSNGFNFEKIIAILSIPVMIVSILWIPRLYLGIIIIIFCILIILSVYSRRRLAFDKRSIRYTLRWNLNWKKVQSYTLDRENGVLTIRTNGESKKITGIKEKDYSAIEKNMNKFMTISNETVTT